MFRGLALILTLSMVSPAWAVDDREVIELSKDQRDFVLMEMRGFLESVQDIVIAVSEDDMEGVKAAAARVGLANMRRMGGGQGPGRAAPMAFRQLGRATHMAFDELSQAADFGPKVVLEDLGAVMSNCTGCHATFRLVEKP